MVRTVFATLAFLALSGCIFGISSESQIYEQSDLSEIGETEWLVLTSFNGATPLGRSTKVSDKGKVTITEFEFGRLEVKEYEEGRLTNLTMLEIEGRRTVRLTGMDDEGALSNCLFGTAKATAGLYVVPTIGACDGRFDHYFIGESDDESMNGFKPLSFDDSETGRLRIEALAAVYKFGISATSNNIFVFGDISPTEFSGFVTDAVSAGLLR